MTKPLRIFVSTLSVEPRYYASCSYKERENNVVVITGKKWDVTDQIEAIVRERLDAIRAAENFGHLTKSAEEIAR